MLGYNIRLGSINQFCVQLLYRYVRAFQSIEWKACYIWNPILDLFIFSFVSFMLQAEKKELIETW